MQSQDTTFLRASKSRPCEICGRTKSCSRKPDGLFFCKGAGEEVPGFFRIGLAREMPGFCLYRKVGDPLLGQRAVFGPGGAEQGRGRGVRLKKPPRKDLQAGRPEHYATCLTIEHTLALAEHLQLPARAVEAIQLLGWWAGRAAAAKRGPGPKWTARVW